MVQFLSGSTRERVPYHEANTYWMLNNPTHLARWELCHDLRDTKYYVLTKAPKDRVLELLARRDRGLLSYEKYAVSELKRFCDQRRIQLTNGVRKADIVKLLEDKDEHTTFDQFLDLPPELRNRIYTLHFESFDVRGRAVPPPISTVSHQLRQESLLLFYQTCTMNVIIYALGYPPSQRDTSGSRVIHPVQILVPYVTKGLFERAPELYLGNIRRFKLQGLVFPPGAWVYATWLVDLGAGNTRVSISNGKPRSQWDRSDDVFNAACKKIETRLRTELEAIMAREGNEKLRRDDLKMFERLFTPEDEQ